jgi:hypothetical protein
VINNEYPTFRHNDIHDSNVLIQQVKKSIIHYKFKNNNFIIPPIDKSVRFWDFDLSFTENIRNFPVDIGDFKKHGIFKETLIQYDLYLIFGTIEDIEEENKKNSDIELKNFLSTFNFIKEFADNNRLRRSFQMDEDRRDMIFVNYKNKEGKVARVPFDNFTAEFILLNDYYFNEFRRGDTATFKVGEKIEEKYVYP